MNLFAIAESALATIRKPTRAERRSAHHASDNFSTVFDTQQRSEGRNATRKFFSAVNGVNDQTRAVAGASRFHVAATHFLTQNVESQSAGDYLRASHFFDAAIGLGYR